MRAPWELAGMPRDTAVAVGFSGGADSVALLALLAERAKTDGFPLLALHIHHGIRGAEADRDEAFCRVFAERLGVDFCAVRVDVPAWAKAHGMGLEEAARELRYRCFADVMAERKIPLLATAHHADDNAETVLFRLARGTGLDGLCGIPAVRKTERPEGGMVVRPLLPFTKEDILAFCRARGLEFVTDSTNREPCCARNILRLEVLPALERAVPNAAATMARTTALLWQDADCLDGLAAEWLKTHCRENALCARDLRGLHPALLGRVLAEFLGGCEAVHIGAAEALIASGRGGSVTMPRDRYASLCGGILRVLPNLRGEGISEPVPLCEGTLALCDGRLTVSVQEAEKCRKHKKVHSLSTTHYINRSEKSVIINQFFWRGLRDGDRIRMGTREVRCAALLQAGGIPATVRKHLPVLCDADGAVVWVPFAGRGDAEPTEGAYAVTLTLWEERTDRQDKGEDRDVRNQSGY
ncbi:MAG TPA: tRNA lysidine(34) synthetase TilS [Clostridiales bacterium]|nr:tRNA lysidine(34) synthetase TilS [Clostridiales bacterium]